MIFIYKRILLIDEKHTVTQQGSNFSDPHSFAGESNLAISRAGSLGRENAFASDSLAYKKVRKK